MNAKTNIAKNFLQLIDKHFPPEHKLHKIFNRNSVKVSYSCMPNASSIIKSHNKKILESQPESRTPKCNCRDQDACPLKGECLIDNIRCLFSRGNKQQKQRTEKLHRPHSTDVQRQPLYKHRNSLRYRTKANNTELFKYVWSLRDKNIDAEIRWCILDKVLCFTEKYHIFFHKEGELLNKKSEILSNCRHKNKFLICNFKETPPDD